MRRIVGAGLTMAVVLAAFWLDRDPSPTAPQAPTAPAPATPMQLSLLDPAPPQRPAWRPREEPLAPEGLQELALERGGLLLRCDLSGLPMPEASDEEPWAGRLAVVHSHDADGRPLGVGALQLQDDILSSLVHADATSARMTWQGHRYDITWLAGAEPGAEVWCDEVHQTARLVRLQGRLVLPDEAPRDVDYRLTVCEQPVRVSAPDFRYDVRAAAMPTPTGDRCLINYGGPAVPDRELSRYTDWIFLTMEHVPLPEGQDVIHHDVVVRAPAPAPPPRSFEDFLAEQLDRAVEQAEEDPERVTEQIRQFVEQSGQVLAVEPEQLASFVDRGASLVSWERGRPLREARRQAQEALGMGRQLLALDDHSDEGLLTDADREEIEDLLERIRSRFPDELLWGSD